MAHSRLPHCGVVLGTAQAPRRRVKHVLEPRLVEERVRNHDQRLDAHEDLEKSGLVCIPAWALPRSEEGQTDLAVVVKVWIEADRASARRHELDLGWFVGICGWEPNVELKAAVRVGRAFGSDDQGFKEVQAFIVHTHKDAGAHLYRKAALKRRHFGPQAQEPFLRRPNHSCGGLGVLEEGMRGLPLLEHVDHGHALEAARPQSLHVGKTALLPQGLLVQQDDFLDLAGVGGFLSAPLASAAGTRALSSKGDGAVASRKSQPLTHSSGRRNHNRAEVESSLELCRIGGGGGRGLRRGGPCSLRRRERRGEGRQGVPERSAHRKGGGSRRGGAGRRRG
mmetsp:Transcript_9029/g.25807  ORF Transcript_9029/g.25807 Transcript_9029/m.25807 type:complete len:337 (-) Transcript_9029:568-1578(-)